MRTKSGLGGRPKGSGPRHNKKKVSDILPDAIFTETEDEITDDIRESIRDALISNIKNIKGWLEAIGQEDPKGAMTLWKDLAEFIVPKLQRSDSKIDPSAPVQLHFESIDGHKARMEEKKKALIATADDYK